ncbi:hypothetical protein BpHYR1_022669 [Brachionus plicatilis]|uniref:Uncharacterized protein n=1 Tax=Brachionus plicatilis TaxID=10195 RepID=A0A3M7SJC6_BRAPC|nr:hypothetical protein BpHYR1_022669 [Brachionus plicatilis]
MRWMLSLAGPNAVKIKWSIWRLKFRPALLFGLISCLKNQSCETFKLRKKLKKLSNFFRSKRDFIRTEFSKILAAKLTVIKRHLCRYHWKFVRNSSMHSDQMT